MAVVSNITEFSRHIFLPRFHHRSIFAVQSVSCIRSAHILSLAR
jgi:hypothetical protein